MKNEVMERESMRKGKYDVRKVAHQREQKVLEKDKNKAEKEREKL